MSLVRVLSPRSVLRLFVAMAIGATALTGMAPTASSAQVIDDSRQVAQVIEALEAYAEDHGSYRTRGAGWRGNGQGWFGLTNANYPNSIASVLIKAGYLAEGNWENNGNQRDLMVYVCEDRAAVFGRSSTAVSSVDITNWNGCNRTPITRRNRPYYQVTRPINEQARANAADEVATALEAYAVDNGTYRIDGAGLNGDGEGWLGQVGGPYPRSIASVLVEGGYLADRDWESLTKRFDLAVYRCNRSAAVFADSEIEVSTLDSVLWRRCTTAAIENGRSYYRVAQALSSRNVSGPSNVAFGVPECSANPIRDKAALTFTITNTTNERLSYRLRAGRHGHSAFHVNAGQTGEFTLTGIPYGAGSAHVEVNGEIFAQRWGLNFGPCENLYESKILSIRFLPGENDRVEFTGTIGDTSDDTLRADMVEKIDDDEKAMMESLRIGSRGQLKVDRVGSLQYNERPPRIATSSRPDYPEILSSTIAEQIGLVVPDDTSEEDIFCAYMEKAEVDSVFIWTNHLTANDGVPLSAQVEPIESEMAFPGNGLSIDNNADADHALPACNHTYMLYNFNITRGASVHNIMHQIENMLGYGVGNYLDDDSDLEGRKSIDKRMFDWLGVEGDAESETLTFTEWLHNDGRVIQEDPHHVHINRDSWAVACGDSHWAPNNPRHVDHRDHAREYVFHLDDEVMSSCLDWNPQNTGTQAAISCATWDGCLPADPTEAQSAQALENYERWWLKQLPGTNPQKPLFYDHSNGTRYPIRNFWQVYADFDDVAGYAIGENLTSVSSYMVDFDSPQP